jgi:hypothetical protein
MSADVRNYPDGHTLTRELARAVAHRMHDTLTMTDYLRVPLSDGSVNIDLRGGIRPATVVVLEPQVETADFVAAVISAHEGVLRSLRRLATGVAWPFDGDAPRDRRIIELYSARRDALEAVPR